MACSRIAAILSLTLTLSMPAFYPPTAFAGEATAQQKAAAEALFDEGKRLKKEGKYLEAAAKLEQSQQLDPGVGTLLHLGDAYEEAGRLASAWASFRQAASLAHESQDSRRQRIADARANKLAPKLGKLSIDLGSNSGIDGLELHRGKVKLVASVAGAPLPVDAGEHTIVVSAPGHEAQSQKVTIRDGETETISFAPLVKLPESPPKPDIPVVGPVVEPDKSIGTAGIGAIVLAGGAVIATGMTVFFAVRAKQLDDEAAEHCEGVACRDMEGEELSNDAKRFAHFGTVGVVVAGAAAAGALSLMIAELTTDSASATPTDTTLTVAPLLTVAGTPSWGLSLGGRW